MAAKLKIIHKDGVTGKNNTEIYNTTLPVNLDSDTAVAVDNWARGVVNLSTDNYQDTEITETVSLNEIINS